MPSTQTPTTTFELAPLVEEICQRWGFYQLIVAGGEVTIGPEALKGLRFFGEDLTAQDLANSLPEQARVVNNSLVLPAITLDSESYNEWRIRLRNLVRILAEENPNRLGREAFYRWSRPRTVDQPFKEALKDSQAFLERSYTDEYIVREKKELVVDYRSCQGNYLASIDRDQYGPLVALLDCSSQIASHISGFNGLPLLGVLRHPESFINPDYRVHRVPAQLSLTRLLLRWAPPGIEHVTYCNSGAEAWEKALALSLVKFPNRGKKVACFRGSFHGRTLLSLFSSWNPKKRLPFQLAGYETLWADFPEDKEPHIDKVAPEGWLQSWSQANQPGFQPPAAGDDELLAREIESLMQVRDLLRLEEVVAVSVEPMQCEGGDRFASNRFFQALRLLTRAYRTALIFDEVQTGFGLGGSTLWSNEFGLQDADGTPLGPDFIVLAKKCQVGAVLSSIADPFPTSAHAASFARGYYNARMVKPHQLERLGNEVSRHLFELPARHPMVANPRGRGLCFAFDLPDGELANAFIRHRFQRGYMVYIAGERTLRFRIQLATREEDIALAFEAISQSLELLEKEGAGGDPEHSDHLWNEPVPRAITLPESLDELPTTDWDRILRYFGQLPDERHEELKRLAGGDPVGWFQRSHPKKKITWLEFLRFLAAERGIRIVANTPELWQRYHQEIMNIEHSIYEPERQDSEAYLHGIVCAERQVSTLALDGERLAGFSFAAPLAHFPQVKGPDEDPMRGKGKVLYSADIGVSPDYQNRGLGLRLKRDQVRRAREAGFRAIRSRNRIDATSSMMMINRSFGSHEVALYENQYGGDAQAVYWSLPVAENRKLSIAWSSGIDEPTGTVLNPHDWEDWDLAAVNKNSLCNWWTPNMVRYVEWLRAAGPLAHLYLASGRDEACDKAIKCLIYYRPGATRCLSFEGAYWGHTTAAARSLSDPLYGTYFPWEHLPYPAVDGDPFADIDGPLSEAEEHTLALLRERLVKGDELLGLFVEPVQEKTGRRLSVRFMRAMRRTCDMYRVPLVFNESASWAYRGSHRLFMCQAAQVVPDLLVFFAGGQVGHVLVNDAYFISDPLMLISTWDGDELSCLRIRAQIRHLEASLDDELLKKVDERLAVAGNTYRGSGRLQLKHPPRVSLQRALGGTESEYVLMPPLNRLAEGIDTLMEDLL